MSEIIGNIWVDKITTEYLDADKMEEVNKITGLDPFREINYVDLSVFHSCPKLKEYVNKERLELLRKKKVDYIAFRLD